MGVGGGWGDRGPASVLSPEGPRLGSPETGECPCVKWGQLSPVPRNEGSDQVPPFRTSVSHRSLPGRSSEHPSLQEGTQTTTSHRTRRDPGAADGLCGNRGAEGTWGPGGRPALPASGAPRRDPSPPKTLASHSLHVNFQTILRGAKLT